MTKRQGEEGGQAADLDAVIAEITADANGEDEQLRAFHDVLQGALVLPCDAFIITCPMPTSRWRANSG